MEIAATIVYVLVICLYIYILNIHRKELKAFKRIYEEQQRSNDFVMDYCIKHIINEYIQNEDYESAAKALKILKNLEKINK